MTARGQHPKADGEREHQKGREPEARQRNPGEADDPRQSIERLVAMSCCHDAERDPDCDGNQKRERRQLQGHRQAFADGLPDRLTAEIRLSEIAPGHVGKPDAVLFDERAIEAPASAESRRGGLVVLETEERGRRVTRNETHEPEREKRQTEQRWHGRGHSPEKRANERHFTISVWRRNFVVAVGCTTYPCTRGRHAEI